VGSVLGALLRRVRSGPLAFVPSSGVRFDRRAGVETEGFAEPSELTVERGSSGEGFSYVPTPPWLVRACLDALAVARAALREPGLPLARLDGPERELRLLVDHREDLVAERTRLINRLRWHLHELGPTLEPAPGALRRVRTLDRLTAELNAQQGLVARLARELVERCRQLTIEIQALEREIQDRVPSLAPSLLAIPGCRALTAAKILGETAGIERFRSPDADARHNGTAPLPVSSAGTPRHRLSRTGNRQLNTALHRIAVTQSQWHPPAKTMIARRKATGDSPREARRVLKRRLSDIVYKALLNDTQLHPRPAA